MYNYINIINIEETLIDYNNNSSKPNTNLFS